MVPFPKLQLILVLGSILVESLVPAQDKAWLSTGPPHGTDCQSHAAISPSGPRSGTFESKDAPQEGGDSALQPHSGRGEPQGGREPRCAWHVGTGMCRAHGLAANLPSRPSFRPPAGGGLGWEVLRLGKAGLSQLFHKDFAVLAEAGRGAGRAVSASLGSEEPL